MSRWVAKKRGIGRCTGAHLAGKQPAMLMQNGGLLNSCNGLTTTALQFGIPILPLIYYKVGQMGDNAFHMGRPGHRSGAAGIGNEIHTVMRDPAKVKQDIVGAVIAAKSSKVAGGLLLTRAVL